MFYMPHEIGLRGKNYLCWPDYAYAVYDLTPIKENGLPRLHDHVLFQLIKHNRLENVHVNALNETNFRFKLVYYTKVYLFSHNFKKKIKKTPIITYL